MKFSLDDDFYVQYDDENEWYEVWGVQTDFCYHTNFDEELAFVACQNLISVKESCVKFHRKLNRDKLRKKP